ncbi:MAG: hypothetical protein A4E60_03567 [Syntrophorhabdus sp. PtaB.Bin047]|nr:MAG: hypothetical protein A4E60_03567 [Syntrophorhabdus sp. PtaB.Bin047]
MYVVEAGAELPQGSLRRFFPHEDHRSGTGRGHGHSFILGVFEIVLRIAKVGVTEGKNAGTIGRSPGPQVLAHARARQHTDAAAFDEIPLAVVERVKRKIVEHAVGNDHQVRLHETAFDGTHDLFVEAPAQGQGIAGAGVGDKTSEKANVIGKSPLLHPGRFQYAVGQDKDVDVVVVVVVLDKRFIGTDEPLKLGEGNRCDADKRSQFGRLSPYLFSCLHTACAAL